MKIRIIDIKILKSKFISFQSFVHNLCRTNKNLTNIHIFVRRTQSLLENERIRSRQYTVQISNVKYINKLHQNWHNIVAKGKNSTENQNKNSVVGHGKIAEGNFMYTNTHWHEICHAVDKLSEHSEGDQNCDHNYPILDDGCSSEHC